VPLIPQLYSNKKETAMKKKIDAMDLKIISILEKNGRVANTELAKKLKTSETTIRNRIKRLIDGGFIKIVAIRNRGRMGHDLSGNIRITADTKKIKSIASRLSKMDQIWYVAQLAGYEEFDVEFSLSSQYDLQVLLEKINKIDGVIATKPSIRLQLIKHLGEFMAEFPAAKDPSIITG
jgi:Lrp/AsnC family transcriptional regulator for asnA, asnC and gidA